MTSSVGNGSTSKRSRRATTGRIRRASKQKLAKMENASAQFPHLGPRLRYARMLLGLSLREVAEQVGVSESFVSKIENDRVRPSLATLHKLVTVLQTNIGILFGDSENDSQQVMLNRHDKRPELGVEALCSSG